MADISEQGWGAGLRFAAMDAATARLIADSWHYPPPYDFYDMAADPDDYDEFVTPTSWPNHCYQVLDGPVLVGFLLASAGDSECELALGLRPDLTSKGLGLDYLRAGLRHLSSVIPDDSRIALEVATFNQRAISVYQRAGFVTVGRFDQKTNGGVHEFVRMELARA